MRLRKMFLPLTIAVVMVVMAACGSGSGSSVDPLIGLWLDEYGNSIEFLGNGTAINTTNLGNEDVRDWERLDDHRIRIIGTWGDDDIVMNVAVSSDTLTIRTGGQASTLTRQID